MVISSGTVEESGVSACTFVAAFWVSFSDCNPEGKGSLVEAVGAPLG